MLRTLTDEDSFEFSDLSELDGSALNDTTNTNDSVCIPAGQVEIIHTDFKSSNWIENFAPKNRDELAIHAKKIAELTDWFRGIKSARVKRSAPILLISGPSGAGKTAALKVLAKEFDYAISEWITPTDIEHTRRGGKNDENDNVTYSESQTDTFSQFLFQSSRYRSVFDTSAKRLVLVEDLPNVFIKDPSSFEDVLERYSIYGKSPLIFIIADTKSRTLNIGYNVFTDNVRQRFQIDTIAFNAVADTMVKKGLKRICAIMSQPGYDQYYIEPSQDTIDSIVLSSQGDMRSAVINLHFTSQKSAYFDQTRSRELWPIVFNVDLFRPQIRSNSKLKSRQNAPKRHLVRMSARERNRQIRANSNRWAAMRVSLLCIRWGVCSIPNVREINGTKSCSTEKYQNRKCLLCFEQITTNPTAMVFKPFNVHPKRLQAHWSHNRPSTYRCCIRTTWPTFRTLTMSSKPRTSSATPISS